MQVKRFCFILSLLLSFLPLGFAQDARPIVRLIYFLPNDRAPQPDIDEKIDTLIKDVQQLYTDQMEVHGFGRKTFLFETDAQGKVIVYHVKGRFNHTYYRNNWGEAWEESYEQLDRGNGYINFTVLDVDLEGITLCGRGSGNGRSGRAFVTTQQGCFNVPIIAHELGHAFGLWHDFRPFGGNWKLVHVDDRMITSFCAAEWLDAIPAFNAPKTPFNQKATIEMLGPPTLVAAPTTFRFRFKVQDPDGLHQVQLHIRDPLVGHYGDSLLDYKGLKGVRSSTLEFVSSILLGPTTHHVVIESIDVHGYTQSEYYPVDLTPLLPPPEVVSIPDTNLAAAIRQKIDNITTYTILNLRELLNVPKRGITKLTGLEHAVNLSTMVLTDNGITDMAPLANLTQLTWLNLSSNRITDVTPLANLTQLRMLALNGSFGGKGITDVTPLANLTQLTQLHLSHNGITDVTPLANLTQLTNLNLDYNGITDVTPLANLTQLTNLDLRVNRISDVSPLLVLNLTERSWDNTGLHLEANPLSYASIHTHIPAMQAKGIKVSFDHVAHPALLRISGDAQEGLVRNPLAAPLIVEAQNEHGKPMRGVSVTFAVDAGEGTLNPRNTTTDADGKAQTTLTLGWTPGTTTIRATATGITSYVRFTATATVLTDRRAEDANSDGVVDVEDLILVASSFGAVPTPDALPDTDVNDDGEVNDADIELVLAALEAAPAAPSLNTQWTAASLQRWIAEAKQRNTGEAIFQRGIAVLEQLLADLLPKQTRLLANYPNPFNPETWIPYQLSEPADVVVRIYGVNGVLVRTLELGHQLAGTYQNRTRAAYWDGRNQLGEPVASGVYFYTLSAGDFTATRKMLIRK